VLVLFKFNFRDRRFCEIKKINSNFKKKFNMQQEDNNSICPESAHLLKRLLWQLIHPGRQKLKTEGYPIKEL